MKKLIGLFFLVGLNWTLMAGSLCVGTYNIRCENASDNAAGNGWLVRCPQVTHLIQKYGFDLFGAQEVTLRQLNDLQTRLPEYASIGVGRDDGKQGGEFSPIFYKKANFRCLRSGTFWLAPSDSIPSVGWDAALPRICTWAQFQRTDGSVFWFYNLHMDHMGKLARLESAKLVLNKITESCGKAPVILTGDFNMDQNSPGYVWLTKADALHDAYQWAATRGKEMPTFNDYQLKPLGNSRIDHLFVTKNVNVLRYEVLTDTYQADTTRLPSDHFPIKVQLEF